MRMLDIPPDTFDRAYNNVANSALWFLLHQLFDTPNQPQFGAGFRRDWESYVGLQRDVRRRPGPGGRRRRRPGAGAGRRPADPGPGLPPVPGPAAAAGAAGRRRPRRPASGTSATRPGRRPTTTGCSRRRSAGPCSTASSARTRPASTPGGGPRRSWTAAPPCSVRSVDAGRAGRAGPGPVGWVTYRGHVTEVAVHPLGVDAPALRERARAEDVRAHVGVLRAGRGRPQADRPGGPHRAVQEHRARPGRVPRAARDPAAVAGPGRAPGLRLPVPLRPGRVPRLHRTGAAARPSRSARSSARRTGTR